MLKLLLSILISPVRGYTFMMMWGWFVTPLGVPHMGLFHATGLSYLISYTVFRLDLSTKEDTRSIWEQAVVSVVFHITCLLVGWLIHLCMVRF